MSNKIKYTPKNYIEIRQELMKNLSIILNMSDIDENTKTNAVNYAIYNWTEANGKYEGNLFWSFLAYKEFAYEKNRSNKLVHEHIVPRKIIREKVKKLPNKDSLSLYLLFEKYVIAAVITKEEDNLFRELYDGQKLVSKMPFEFYDESNLLYFDNPWARYIKVNYQFPKKAIDIRKIEKWQGKLTSPTEFLGPTQEIMDTFNRQ